MAENEWKQKALLPKLLKEEDASYNAVVDLQKALAHENIYNIALTGPFGAGKSSVLSTLIKNANKNGNDGLHFLSISLATLDATKEINAEQQEDIKIPQGYNNHKQYDNGKYQDKYQFNKGFGGQIQYPDDYSKEDIQGIRGSGYRNQIASLVDQPVAS